MRGLARKSSMARAFRVIASLCVSSACVMANAEARTATYDANTPFTPGYMTALSTAGDKAGQFVTLGKWMSLLFAQPFGLSKTDTVSIFTLAPPAGSGTFTISFGRYNNGRPVYADTRTLVAGSALTINNLFQKGCSALGGCDFIFITTSKTKGATGATIDYVSVNGDVTEVTAPTPEPSVWALMIIGFGAAAWRLKNQRGVSLSSANGSPARCSK